LWDKFFGVLKLIGAETDWTVMRPNGGNFQNGWKITNTRDVKKIKYHCKSKADDCSAQRDFLE